MENNATDRKKEHAAFVWSLTCPIFNISFNISLHLCVK